MSKLDIDINIKQDDLLIVKANAEGTSQILRTWLRGDEITVNKAQPKEFTGMQKAAIFIISIGKELANDVLVYMTEQEIDEIMFEVARYEVINLETKEHIFNEYLELLTTKQFHSNNGGIEYAKDVLNKLFGTQKATETIKRLNSFLQIRPFDCVRRCDPVQLLNILRDEHPQIIALVLSFLEPNKAALLLQNFPTELQTDVFKRIVCMNIVAPEIVREIERVIEKKLSTVSSEDYSTCGGIGSGIEILNLLDREAEKNIIEFFEDEDPELAEELKNRMFVFEDILILDNIAIQKLMREIDSQELAKALKSADQEIQDKIFRNMSRRAEEMLREDMDYMGPVRLKDVEEAQQNIVEVIRKLEEDGEIIISRTEIVETEIMAKKFTEREEEAKEDKIDEEINNTGGPIIQFFRKIARQYFRRNTSTTKKEGTND